MSGAAVAALKAMSAIRWDVDAFRKLNATLELFLLNFIHQFQLKSVQYQKELFRLKFALKCVRTKKSGILAAPAMVLVQSRIPSATKCVDKEVVAVWRTMSENREVTIVSTSWTVPTPSFRFISTGRMK